MQHVLGLLVTPWCFHYSNGGTGKRRIRFPLALILLLPPSKQQRRDFFLGLCEKVDVDVEERRHFHRQLGGNSIALEEGQKKEPKGVYFIC